MRPIRENLIRLGQILAIVFLGLIVFFAVSQAAGGVRNAHALPEYTDRVGESCGVCHVNPGGGGPRTLTGLLWAARGRGDQLPELAGLLAAPPQITDGLELYDIACAGCHGYQGEGLSAFHLAGTGVSRPAVRSFILRGIPDSGMPGFEGKFTEQQLENLVDFVATVTSEADGIETEFQLPPPSLDCAPVSETRGCGE